MAFIRQIKYEIRNILKSKFILIIGILVLAASVVLPVISVFSTRPSYGGGGLRPLPIYSARGIVKDSIGYPEISGQDPIIVDGITIQPDNPFYWQINGLQQEKEYMEMDKGRFSSTDVLDLALALMDEEIKFYARFAQHITKHTDYRMELSWLGVDTLYDKFIYEHNDVAEDKLLEAVGYRKGLDLETLKEKYIDITPEEKLAALDEIDEKLNTLYSVVENNDFPKYIDLRIEQENANIENIKEQIAIQEKAIIENPSQEEAISQYIEDLKRQIEMIETSTIPTLEYRLAKNIIPGEEVWQNTALMNIEHSKMELLHNRILTEEEFNKETYLVHEYKNYQNYLKVMQARIDELNNEIIIGQRSLDADKPDMKYVPEGARNRTIQFLQYSTFVAMFAALLGGWLMASEFQQGTIRLLMIRPKTRTKILLAKFIAAFVIIIGIYTVGSLLNIITNGACFGFPDFAYPNYTISGEINFFVYYIPKFLACTMPIIFAFTVAFMLSVVVKNVAVSIIIPIACFIGSSIVMGIFSYSSKLNWIAYTPIPFLQLSSFFAQYSSVKYAIPRGVPLNLGYGIMLLLVLSVICTLISMYVFNRRDITN